MQAHHGAECFNQSRLAQTGQTHQKAMPATQQGRQRQFDNALLTDKAIGD